MLVNDSEVKVNHSINTNTKNIKKGNYSAALCFVGIIAYTLLIAYVPFALFANTELAVLEGVSVAAVAVCAFIISKLAGARRPMISFLTLMAVIFVASGTFVGCGLVSACIATVIPACVFVRSDNFAVKVLPFLTTAAVYLVSYLWLGSFLRAMACLVFLPASLALIYALKRRLSRVSVICLTASAIIFSALAALALRVIFFHSADFTEIPEMIEYARGAATSLLSQGMELVSEQLGMSLGEVDMAAFSETVVTVVFNVIPSLAVVAALIIAFMLQSFAASVLASSEEDEQKIINLYAFRLSTASAVLFLVFFLLAATLSLESLDVYSVTAQNLTIIFMPGMIYTAMIALRHHTIIKKPSCFGFLIYFGALSLFLYMTPYAIIISSLAGASIIIINSVRLALSKKA